MRGLAPFPAAPAPAARAAARRAPPAAAAARAGGGGGGGDAPRRRQSGGRPDDGRYKSGSSRGFEKANRRRGRPAWLRSPDDTPLRDGNRDRLMGLLTERAARTLLFYMFEINLTQYGWFNAFCNAYTIPRDGNWDDVSGETFLRTLLSMPVQEASHDRFLAGRDPMYHATGQLGVDPRSIAQRVMDIRSQIAKEMIADLKAVSEENALLMRETLLSSLAASAGAGGGGGGDGGGGGGGGARHPELDEPDDSAGGGDD